jgi:hypothetical protein
MEPPVPASQEVARHAIGQRMRTHDPACPGPKYAERYCPCGRTMFSYCPACEDMYFVGVQDGEKCEHYAEIAQYPEQGYL